MYFFQIGMLSACINPVLYGFLNETFKREFKEISRQPFCCSHQLLAPTLTNGESQPALELKVIEDNKTLIKVENKLIPREPISAFNLKQNFKSKEQISNAEFVTVHQTSPHHTCHK